MADPEAVWKAFELPVQPRSERITLTLGGATYIFTTRWCTPSNCWLLDIDDVSGKRLLSGIPLVTGANLLRQFGYLGIKGAFYVISSDGPADVVPSFTSLGVTGKLYWVPPQ